jgi:hypothetical protein
VPQSIMLLGSMNEGSIGLSNIPLSSIPFQGKLAISFVFGSSGVFLGIVELWALKPLGFSDISANLSIKGEFRKSSIQFQAADVTAFMIFQPILLFTAAWFL